MTIKLEVSVSEDIVRAGDADKYIEMALAAVGFRRDAPEETRYEVTPPKAEAPAEPMSDASEKPTDNAEGETPVQRERGKPAPGKARRTKAEIEEDEAADAADAAPQVRYFYHPESNCLDKTEDGSHPGTDGLLEEIDAEKYAEIEKKIADEEAQDAADEKADDANASGADATRDNVREAMEAFLNANGLPALNAAFGGYLKEAYPDGSVTNLKMIPENPEDFAKAIAFLQSKMEG